MNKLCLLSLLTLIICLPIAARADQSNLATPFGNKSDTDAKNQIKAKNYIRSEYIHAQMIARVALMYDECVKAGQIVAGPISAETKFNEYVDKEKIKPSTSRPDMVADQEISNAMHQAYSDSEIKLKSTPSFIDQRHCALTQTIWPHYEKRFGLE